MGTIYIQTTGATTNSGSSDNNAADLSGTGDAVVAGSDVVLTAGTVLTGIVTSGVNQSAIYLAQATNTNQKVFWITAVAGSGGATPTVTVSVAPTGVTASNWAIGGRMVLTNANLEGAVRPGDIVQFNDSPAARAATFWTCRTSGDSTGYITLMGKSGVYPTLNVTNTAIVITGSTFGGWKILGFTFDQDGASGSIINGSGAGWLVSSNKVIDCGGTAFLPTGSAWKFINNEITGAVDAVTISASAGGLVMGNYIHDNTGSGVTFSAVGPQGTVAFNIIESNSGKGVLISGASTTQAHLVSLINNTIYGNGDSGLEVTDADTVVAIRNNIFSENGNAAGEFNVEWSAGAAENVGFHGYNLFFHSGGGGGANLSGLTTNSTELTTDPVFANAAGGDFSLDTTSPAKATGFPGTLLSGSTGYIDLGAVQRQEAGGGGGTGISRARAFGGFA